jgi:uncharacterized protein (TIGR02246 family)
MAYTLQQLSDFEDIRTLKHRYFRCIDTAQADELAELFTEDVQVDYRGGNYRVQLSGRDAMLKFLANAFHSDAAAMHHGHMPELRLTGQDTAEGSWYLEDIFINTTARTRTAGTAIYRDRYKRVDGRWLIAATEYDRVIEVIEPLSPEVQVTHQHLARHGLKPHEREDISMYLSWTAAA